MRKLKSIILKTTGPGRERGRRGWPGHAVVAVTLVSVLLSCFFAGCAGRKAPDKGAAQGNLAGLRSSSYGAGNPFPSTSYWVDSCNSMASRFESTGPAVVWIVGVMDSEDDALNSDTLLNFPRPVDSKQYPLINFMDTDRNRDYLDAFDRSGVKVWLQVEPADADISQLIRLVLDRYAHHSCVIGFGVDVEWFRWSKATPEGVAVTDAQAREWSELVRSYNPSYRLFLKHWLKEKMPQTYREGLMFLDDSQQFRTLEQMVLEFEEWGAFFSPAPVGFQYGYPADKVWWGKFSDPPAEIGREILRRVPNARELYWVDFTMKQIWPN